MIQQWVKDMVDKHSDKEEVINGNTFKKITEPKPGDKLYFQAFHNNNKCGYKEGDFYKVEIISGKYWGAFGLSNFWHWYKLDENDNRIKEEHGYGNFLME